MSLSQCSDLGPHLSRNPSYGSLHQKIQTVQFLVTLGPRLGYFQQDTRGTPPKKPKVKDSDDDDEDSSRAEYDGHDGGIAVGHRQALNIDNNGDDSEFDGDTSLPHGMTAMESSLPVVATGKAAIEEYEAIRASQASQSSQPGKDIEEETAARLENQQWVRGKSSIYVDAFNLALDTVLEDEAHLFDKKERRVFEQWRTLDYEAQYLYVRLFLRKTASWHRVERLGYHSDISDVGLAIANLLESRELPDDPSSDLESAREMQQWSLGESFALADDSESCIRTMDVAASLLSLDELKTLTKEAKVQGKNKADLLKAFCRTSARQSGLLSLGLRRSSTHGSTDSKDSQSRDASPEKQDSNRNAHFLSKILAITGPLIRLSEPVFKLFERIHLVFYRSTEWTEKSLTTIILAKMARRNFPQYLVCRSSNIFSSRRDLLEFEHSMRQEFEVDKILEFNGPPGEEGFQRALCVFEAIAERWRELLREEQQREDNIYEFGEGGYLRRFNAAHAYTRIAHKAAHVLGRLHRHKEEHELLTELLSQRLFHPARRGFWYQRKALLEERYMWEVDSTPISTDSEIQKKYWQRIAVTTCEAALEDRDCHLIYHYDLQKRLLKLEKRLRIPRRLQHDFGHVKLRQPEEHTVQGIQLVRDDETEMRGKAGRGPSTKTVWLDELGEPGEDGKPCHASVEEMCLSHYRSEGWKGYHSEGGILRTLFAYLFYDVLFVYIPNVFQTAFQTCPLDLYTDAFFPARASEVNHRLVEIGNGGAERFLREVGARERERRTCVVGLNWDFEVEELVELVNCFGGEALSSVCKVMAQDYKSRGGGVPDLVLWRTSPPSTISPGRDGGDSEKNGMGEVMFAEVKSANDRLSDTQRLWIHVLTGAGIRVALCNAVAKEVRTIG
ncbi:VRR-NUC domain-containing protein [Lasiosphaeris hirsuta]|uniref:Fanconi-associated nuclease n=1 Tax=Lasiosphaeris hirsuta TaxID=260670 RepID=A0AA40BAT0_9PEZI|nr:VRR-NUC domain-containing protein [Lasiosphaeris hirsuta]